MRCRSANSCSQAQETLLDWLVKEVWSATIYEVPFDPFPPILLEIEIKLVWFAIRA